MIEFTAVILYVRFNGGFSYKFKTVNCTLEKITTTSVLEINFEGQLIQQQICVILKI